MIEESLWHPVAATADLTSRPLACRLLERDIVLWRDEASAVHAWPDRCPHRGAKLSLGRIEGNRLECAYHGWQFSGSGHCVKVPSLPDFKPPQTHCVPTYSAREACGLVWVKLAASEVAMPAFAAETDTRLRKLNCGPYDVLTSAPRLVENFLDMSHFGFVHDGWLGMRSATAVGDYNVTATPNGLLATQCKAWQPQSNVHSSRPAQVEYSYEVTAPYSAVLTKVPDAASVAFESYHESIALFLCPVTPEITRVWFRLAVADFESGDDKLRDFQHTIFMQDKPVLESQQPKRLPLDVRAELHTAADRASSFYRRHLRHLGIGFGVC